MSASVITTRGLRKCYGHVVAVDSLDLDIPRGAVFGLLGPNGAGKSTTFGILCGWLSPTAGTASVMGIESRSLHRLRGRVAVLPQDARFPPQVSVRDQLAHFGRLNGMAGDAARQEAERVLGLVNMSDAADRLGSQLSHGMLKRVGVAQALIGTPEVVLLDEPTAGLDPKSARELKDLVASLAPQTTVILSSHNLAEVQEVCTHGAILDHGKLAVAGTIEDLTRRGTEISIELAPESDPPRSRLEELFGAEAVRWKAPHLRILLDTEMAPAEGIRRALEALFADNTPVLGVQRGTSLETAFLEITGTPSD